MNLRVNLVGCSAWSLCAILSVSLVGCIIEHEEIPMEIGEAQLPTCGETVDVIIDKNGFPNAKGGQVTGPGLAAPIPLGRNDSPVLLSNLLPGATYKVDIGHNGINGGSDFTFTVDALGNGVASVSLSDGGQIMVVGFSPGSTSLKLNTHEIVYNANSGQTGRYFLLGSHLSALGMNTGPITAKVLPGVVPVDNTYFTGGKNEDYSFFVDSNGQTSAFVGYEEYATFSGSSVSPRAVKVHYHVEASGNLPNIKNAYLQPMFNFIQLGSTYDFDMMMTIGNAGVCFSDFGSYTIDGGNAIKPDGTPWLGTTGTNDYYFLPRLRFDTMTGFSWNGSGATVATGSASGFRDGNTLPLSVTVTATIVP